MRYLKTSLWAFAFFIAAIVGGLLRWPAGAPVLDTTIGPYGSNAVAVTDYSPEIQSRIDSLWRRIEIKLKEIDPEYLSILEPPVTSEQLAQFEKRLGYRVPAELLAFWKIHAGQKHERGFLSDWSLLSIDESVGCTLESISGFCPTGGMPSHLQEFSGWPPGFVVFATNQEGNLCVGLEDGQIWLLYIDSGFELQSPCFSEWLEQIAKRVEKNQLGVSQYDRDNFFEGQKKKDHKVRPVIVDDNNEEPSTPGTLPQYDW